MKNEDNARINKKEAVALSYKRDSLDAPKVVAKGSGTAAEKIIAKASEHQILIKEDPSLVSLLGNLDVNERIPEELYQAVAEVFAFVYKLDSEVKNIEK